MESPKTTGSLLENFHVDKGYINAETRLPGNYILIGAYAIGLAGSSDHPASFNLGWVLGNRPDELG